jgi:hypothetical protein
MPKQEYKCREQVGSGVMVKILTDESDDAINTEVATFD